MQEDLIFVGYRQFTSKKNGNDYYVVDFITQPKQSQNGNCTIANVPIFLDKQAFSKFVQSNKLLSTIKANVEIQGTTVRYSL